MVRLRAEPALRRGRPPGAIRRGRGRGRRQHRLRRGADPEPRLRACRHGPDDQRSGQRRARDHGRLDPPRHAAHLRRVLFLVQGADRRRPHEARPGRPGEKILSCDSGQADRCRQRRGRAVDGGPLPRGQRHQHGGTARFRRHRRVPVDPPRVHRPGRGGAADLPGRGHRPQSGADTSRARAWST